MRTNHPEFCPNCQIGINNNERQSMFCQNCKTDFSGFESDYHDDDFECCSNCDLPDACEDFGCAIKQGLKEDDSY